MDRPVYCRQIWHLLVDEHSRTAVEVGERLADGLTDKEPLVLIQHNALLASARQLALFPRGRKAAQHRAACMAFVTVELQPVGDLTQRLGGHDPTVFSHLRRKKGRKVEEGAAVVLRDLFGTPPFRPVILPPSVRTWNGGTAVRLAQAAYANRQLPAGTLEPERLMVLADALEEAGARDQEVLRHLREHKDHWRGCWVMDLLLGKE